MKTLQYLLLTVFFAVALTTSAQTADEIVNTYIENIGGEDAWSEVETMTMTGIGRQQGVDYPFEAIYMEDGRYVIDVDLQGTSFIVEAFDGINAWAMNFNTQKAEASDSETSLNTKNQSKDQIVSPFFDYEDKGYNIELVGEDTWEGTDVYKVKLTKKPVMVDGKEEDNIEMFYFDKDNYVPIASEGKVTSGPAKGSLSQTIYSDYQEVDGKYIPFTIINKFNGQVGLEMKIESVAFNKDVDESIFDMPKE